MEKHIDHFPVGADDLRCRMGEELDSYYADFDPCTDELKQKLDALAPEFAACSPYGRKAMIYELLARECPIHLFRQAPFFHEFSCGRARFHWGGQDNPVGAYLLQATRHQWLDVYAKRIAPDLDEGFLHGWWPVNFDHFCLGYDKILSLGILGIIRQAESALAQCKDTKKQDFYRNVIRANRALLLLAERFADEADRLAGLAETASDRAHYEKIAAAARHVPGQPPRTFYEGLCAIVFCREAFASLEGIGVSTFGHLDRLLLPLYRQDLEKGTITREEATELVCRLLIYIDVRFDIRHSYHETSTTIELGGCDREGSIVCNGLTEVILDAVLRVRATATKINCRISKSHPQWYLEKIARIQLANLPVIMMHNDDVLIPARVRQGQAVQDARCYLGCGCHEIVLQNTEVCSRAFTWINVPRLLLATLESGAEFESYDALYQAFLEDTRAYHRRIARLCNDQEKKWARYSPMVLYSSTMADSLEKGLDVTEGGARYNNTTLSMLGTATVIDSLYAIRHLVFDEKRLTLPQLRQILADNFENQEPLRQYIIRKLPKYGTNDAAMNQFSAQVLSDLSRVSGQTNGRGGKYLPAFYPHEIYVPLGKRTGATPDGRLAGTSLSRGCSPSEFIETDSPLDLVHSLKPIDFTAYADSFIAEITLPRMEANDEGMQILCAIIRGFLEAEGSSLQFNMVSREQLIAARKNPENHKNLLVRVCGYSAPFVFLAEHTQDEIITRAVR